MAFKTEFKSDTCRTGKKIRVVISDDKANLAKAEWKAMWAAELAEMLSYFQLTAHINNSVCLHCTSA